MRDFMSAWPPVIFSTFVILDSYYKTKARFGAGFLVFLLVLVQEPRSSGIDENDDDFPSHNTTLLPPAFLSMVLLEVEYPVALLWGRETDRYEAPAGASSSKKEARRSPAKYLAPVGRG